MAFKVKAGRAKEPSDKDFENAYQLGQNYHTLNAKGIIKYGKRFGELNIDQKQDILLEVVMEGKK